MTAKPLFKKSNLIFFGRINSIFFFCFFEQQHALKNCSVWRGPCAKILLFFAFWTFVCNKILHLLFDQHGCQHVRLCVALSITPQCWLSGHRTQSMHFFNLDAKKKCPELPISGTTKLRWQQSLAFENATPWFAYNLAMHRVSSCGTYRVVTHSQKTRFSACRTSCC